MKRPTRFSLTPMAVALAMLLFLCVGAVRVKVEVHSGLVPGLAVSEEAWRRGESRRQVFYVASEPTQADAAGGEFGRLVLERLGQTNASTLEWVGWSQGTLRLQLVARPPLTNNEPSDFFLSHRHSPQKHCEPYSVCTPPRHPLPTRRKQLQARLAAYRNRPKKRVLFLNSKRLFEQSVDRWYFLQYNSAKQHERYEAVLWGPGFDSWVEARGVGENIAVRYGSADYFDLIYMGRPYFKESQRFGDRIPTSVTIIFLHESFNCLRRTEKNEQDGAPRYCTMGHGDVVLKTEMEYVDVAMFGFARETKFYPSAALRRLFVSQPIDASDALYKPREKGKVSDPYCTSHARRTSVDTLVCVVWPGRGCPPRWECPRPQLPTALPVHEAPR